MTVKNITWIVTPSLGMRKVVGFINFKIMNLEVPKVARLSSIHIGSYDRKELLTLIKKNRDKHKTEYADAVVDYKILATKEVEDAMSKLRQKIQDLKGGENLVLHHIGFNITIPEDHTSDYDRIIMMLEMDDSERIKLDENQFQCYAMDQWDWREHWRETYFSNKLSATAAMK